MMNQPAFPPEHRGLVHIASGRPVWWTGKVCIGLVRGLGVNSPRRLAVAIDHRASADADRLQSLLLRHKPKPVKTGINAKRPTPAAPLQAVIPTTWRGRLVNFVRGCFK